MAKAYWSLQNCAVCGSISGTAGIAKVFTDSRDGFNITGEFILTQKWWYTCLSILGYSIHDRPKYRLALQDALNREFAQCKLVCTQDTGRPR